MAGSLIDLNGLLSSHYKHFMSFMSTVQLELSVKTARVWPA